MLGGQHSLAAAKERRKLALEKGLEPARWLQVCFADILKSTLPVEIREMEAGADQYRQQAVFPEITRRMSPAPRPAG